MKTIVSSKVAVVFVQNSCCAGTEVSQQCCSAGEINSLLERSFLITSLTEILGSVSRKEMEIFLVIVQVGSLETKC